MPQDFSGLSDQELLALARRAGIVPPEQSGFDKALETTENIGGKLGLGGLALSFVPHPAAKAVGRLAMGLSGVGYMGAGAGRLAQGDITRGGLEFGLGTLGTLTGGPLMRPIEKAAGRGINALKRGVSSILPKTIAKVPPNKLDETLDLVLKDELGPAFKPKPTTAPVTPPPTTPPVSPVGAPTTLEAELVRRGVRKPPTTVQMPPPIRPGPVEMDIPQPPKAGIKGKGGPRFKMTAEEKKLAAYGRERAAATGSLGTPAVEKSIDRLGTEYQRTVESLATLKKMTAGDEAAQQTLKDLEHARTYAGMALKKARQLAKGGKVVNEAQLNKALQEALKNAGFISTELATRIVMASAGAAAGASAGDTTMERVGFGVAGGVAGALGPEIAGKARQFAKDPRQAIEDITFFSLLSNPATLTKAGMGAIGGAISKGEEMIAHGILTSNPKEIANGAKILKAVLTTSPKVWTKAMLDTKVSESIIGGVPGKAPTRSLGYVGQALSAGDAAGVAAMREGGVSVEEAMRYTLGGNPTSKLGQHAISWLKKPKFGRHVDKNLKSILTQVAPFPRTAAQMIERGLLERTPLGLGQLLSPKLRAALDNTKEPASKILLKAGQGTAVMGLGASMEPRTPDQLTPYYAAAMGPYGVPYALGWHLNRAKRSGKPAYSGASQALTELSPLSRDPLALFTRPAQEIASRVVPGGIAQLAQAMDPAYSRQTGPVQLTEEGFNQAESMLGNIMARIPKLRERLPEVDRPVDAFGRPKVRENFMGNRPGSLPVFLQKLISSPRGALPLPPTMDLADPRLKMLHDTGVNLSPRSSSLSYEGFDVPLDRDAKLRLQRARGLAVQTAVQIFSSVPAFANMPPGETKKLIWEEVLKMVQDSMGDDIPAAAALGAFNGTR